jgi:hypothetical protein
LALQICTTPGKHVKIAAEELRNMRSFLRISKGMAWLVAVLSFHAVAGAAIINVDLGGYRGTEAAQTTYSGTSPAGSGTTWNGLTVANSTGGTHGPGFSDGTTSTTTGDQQTINATSLLNDAGGSSTVTFGIGPVGVDNEVGTQGTNILFYDYVFNQSAGNTGNTTNFTIGGLPTNTTVTLFLYSNATTGSPNLAGLSVTNGTKQTFVPVGVFTTSNTVEYTVPTGAGTTVSGQLANSGTANVLSGFTVVTPEPGAFSLVVLSVFGLLALRRRLPTRASIDGTCRRLQ